MEGTTLSIKSKLSTVIIVLCISISFKVNSQNTSTDKDPGARWGHVFVYDQNRQQILLFGGKHKRGGTYLNDTWIWKNNSWMKIDVQGPNPRGFCAVAYHEGRKTIILHGGRGNNGLTYSDLWEWNGVYWTQIEDQSSFKADHHQLVYLNEQKSLLAFGGWNGKEVMGDTWLWNGQWEKLKITSPPKRASFSMVNKKNRIVLYGGLWINGQYADIWEWSDNMWQSLCGPYDNSSIDHHSMIYDSKLDQVIGFGGKNYRYKFQNKTFRIENGLIVLIDVDGPSARHSFGFTYDSQENFGYLYGGKDYIKEEQIALGDFWKWDGKKWIKLNKD